jgi:hypothetical protein
MDEEIFLDDDPSGVSMETDSIQLEGEGEPQNTTPLGFEMEQAPREEMNAILQGFKSRSEREDQRVLDATDSEYWVALCFQTREQKEEFLNKLRLIDLGDKYIDGMKAAKVLGVKLESRIPDMPRHRPFDREYLDIALDIEE